MTSPTKKQCADIARATKVISEHGCFRQVVVGSDLCYCAVRTDLEVACAPLVCLYAPMTRVQVRRAILDALDTLENASDGKIVAIDSGWKDEAGFCG